MHKHNNIFLRIFSKASIICSFFGIICTTCSAPAPSPAGKMKAAESEGKRLVPAQFIFKLGADFQ